MVMHGLETTVPVTLDMMILQGRAVMRGSKRALVVVDMPFGSYEESREQAFRNAARVLKETGAGAIKLEGGAHMAETVAFLVTPRRAGDGACRADAAGGQHDGRLPRAGAQRRGAEAAGGRRPRHRRCRRFRHRDGGDRRAGRPRRHRSSIAAPTIGIGASPACDGQILVLEDMLGLSDWAPKFVKKFGVAARADRGGGGGLCRARSGPARFPGPEQVYQPQKALRRLSSPRFVASP